MRSFARLICRFLMFVLSKTTIIGKENIPKEGNCIFASNHQSLCDAYVNFAVLPKNTHFMAKKELFSNFLLKWALPKLNVFSVDREKNELKAIRHAIDVLKNGNYLCVFPQGTRTNGAAVERDKMHGGVAMIAMRENSAVVPLMFTSKPSIFGNNTLIIGKKIDFGDLNGAKFNNKSIEQFTDILTQKMNALITEGKK